MSTGKTKIQIARRQLGLDDDTYRALLERTVGERSSVNLSPRQVGRVLAELERLGWQPQPRKGAGRQVKPAAGRAALVGKINAFLAEAGRPVAYADAMALRMYHVERLEWCNEEQLRGIVSALAYDARRHGRPQA